MKLKPVNKKKSARATLGKKSADIDRPKFSTAKQKAARLEATLATGKNYMKANLVDEDLAQPHRAPYSKIRDLIYDGSPADVTSSVTTLFNASLKTEHALKGVSKDKYASSYTELADLYKDTREIAERRHSEYIARRNEKNKKKLTIAVNNLASNAPGLGPHSGINQPVSDRLHLHPTGIPSEPLTPRSQAAVDAFPDIAIATIDSGRNIISVTGDLSYSNPFSRGMATKDINVNRSTGIVEGSLIIKGNKVYKRRSNGSLKLIE